MRAKQNGALKVIAGILTTVFLICAVGCAVLWGAAQVMKFGTSSYAYIENEMLGVLVRDHLGDVANTYFRGDDPVSVYANTNLIFRIYDGDGNVVAQSSNTEQLKFHAYETIRAWDERYTLQGDVDRNLPHADRYSVLMTLLRTYYDIYPALLFIALGCAVVWLVLLIWLMSAAGHHRDEDAPRRGWMEFVPFDLLVFGLLLWIGLHDALFWGMGDAEFVVTLSAFVLADAVLLTLTMMTLAVRLKTHTLLRSTLIWYVLVLAYRILVWCWRGVKRVCGVVFGTLGVAFGSIPLVWKTALGVLFNGMFDLFMALMCADIGTLFVMILFKDFVIGAVILFCAVLMRRIQAGGERLAAGELTAKIDTRYMFGDFRKFSENMNRLGDGMSAAVEERLRSERFRTELITNVSHDIKTPLTSIVNYVDLMDKENVTEEPLAGYIEVLKRQAARLKKLTEDLIEASKAATGAIAVHPEPLDVTVLLGQTAGEYDEKLRAAGLDLILHQPDGAVTITADGRLLWRVFDNLMNNILKYALPGTRVYLSLYARAGDAEIVFRNIARDELSVDSEELLQRFTRGDASRSTEGSGLGLSIANSLTELQGGELSLNVDGDLFKVTLRFPLAE